MLKWKILWRRFKEENDDTVWDPAAEADKIEQYVKVKILIDKVM